MSTPPSAQPAQPPEQPHPTMELKPPAPPADRAAPPQGPEDRPPSAPPAPPSPSAPAAPAPQAAPAPAPGMLQKPPAPQAPQAAPQAPQPQAPQAPPQAPPLPAPQQPHAHQPFAGGTGLPGGAYTSPIPVRGTHLGHALASEWTKIRSVRSTMWTLGVFLVLVVGIGLLTSLVTEDRDYMATPYTVPAFIGLILGQICLITLGVLVITSEYGTGMARTTFTASPQRHRVLVAKFLVFFVVAFVVSVLSVELVGLATSAMHSGASDIPWAGTVLKGSLYVSLLGVLSLAVGTLLRHSAGAITAMLGLVLVPAIMPAFLLISQSTQKIGELLLDYSAPNSLAKIFLDSDGPENGTKQLMLLLAITVVTVAGAFLALDRRDV